MTDYFALANDYAKDLKTKHDTSNPVAASFTDPVIALQSNLGMVMTMLRDELGEERAARIWKIVRE